MQTRKHRLDEVLRSLAKKNDCIVVQAHKTVFVYSQQATARQNDLGNGSWGKISYLQSQHGYMVVFSHDIGASAIDLEKHSIFNPKICEHFRLSRKANAEVQHV